MEKWNCQKNRADYLYVGGVEMLLKKAERVIKEKGISALKIKVVNRVKGI